jgi:thymidylate synthase (FAD)
MGEERIVSPGQQITDIDGVPVVVMGAPQVHLIARTQFLVDPKDVEALDRLGVHEWNAMGEATDAELLSEFSGRACYSSWKNLGRKTTEAYNAHLLELGHGSVFEHPSWSFYMWRVSRGYTHEQVRHRPGWAYSQLSTRYVDALIKSSWERLCILEPRVIAEDPEAHEVWLEGVRGSVRAYDRLTEILGEKGFEWVDTADLKGKTVLRKNVRQAARSVLPIGVETRIVVTGNARSWRHFIDMRATRGADVEIRSVAVAVLKILKREAPRLFSDYVLSTAEDGTEIASSRYSVTAQPDLLSLARLVRENLDHLPSEARARGRRLLKDVGMDA